VKDSKTTNKTAAATFSPNSNTFISQRLPNIYTHNCFMALDFVQDNPGQLIPQETFTHSVTHTCRGHQLSLICFIHLIRSVASSLFSLRNFLICSAFILLNCNMLLNKHYCTFQKRIITLIYFSPVVKVDWRMRWHYNEAYQPCWPWHVTFSFNPLRVIILTHTHPKD